MTREIEEIRKGRRKVDTRDRREKEEGKGVKLTRGMEERREKSSHQGWKREGRGEWSKVDTRDGRGKGVKLTQGMEERRKRGWK